MASWFPGGNNWLIGGRWYEIKKPEIRCKGIYKGRPCNRRLFDGLPGFDIISNKPKIIEIKCPKCGAMNIVNCEIEEKVIIRLKK